MLAGGGGGAGDLFTLGLAGVGESGGGGVGRGCPEKPGLLTREIFNLGLVVDGSGSVSFGPSSSSPTLRRRVSSHSEGTSSLEGGGGKSSLPLMSSLW